MLLLLLLLLRGEVVVAARCKARLSSNCRGAPRGDA
jgi:hypothetical protein